MARISVGNDAVVSNLGPWRIRPTILLVDDEESVQKLLTYPLERDGFRVVHAWDGEEALARFSEEASTSSCST